MTSPKPSIVVAHSSPGRLRLRLAWLRDKPGRAEEVADELAALAGITEVRVRRSTGSVLCLYDGAVLDEARLVAAVAAICSARAARTGETEESRPPLAPTAKSVANALKQGFNEIDRELRRATEGRLDLGTVAAFGFLGLGAAEVVTTRRMPIPPWFNLAWWAFRTITAFEHEEGVPDDDADELTGDPAAS